MKYNPEKHHRRSIRLKGYDYSQSGVYFVTICTQNRVCFFGNIVDDEMDLNRYGEIVNASWRWLTDQYGYIQMDTWVIIPNHLHGIIILDGCRGHSRIAPTGKMRPLGRLIGAFKIVSTKRINALYGMPGMRI